MKTLLTPSLALALIIIGIFIGWILFSEIHCGKEGKTEITSTTDTLVRIKVETDTFYKDTGSIKSVPYAVYIPAKIDTPAAITDYYTFKSVQDSFIGKNYRVLLDDTLYMNSLFARKVQVTTTQTDSLIHTTTTIRKSADGLYLGAETNLNYIGPDVMFIKGKWSYGGNIKFDPSTGFKAKELNLRANYRLFGR